MRFYTTERLSDNIARTPEGFLAITEVPVARCGIQIYSPGEVPSDVSPDGDGKIIINRDPEDVFHPVALASAQGKPFVDEHPTEGDNERIDVTPANWKKYLAGIMLNPRRGEGISDDLMFVDLMVYDPDTIQKILDGKRELSCGYEADYEVLGPGHAKQTNIILNHLALVDSGRCGQRCSIRDGICSIHGPRQVKSAKARDHGPTLVFQRNRHLHIHY